MALGYGIDGIGNDPYFMYAYNSPNFMANYQTQAAQAAAANQAAQAGQTNTVSQSEVVTTPYTNTKKDSNAGTVAGVLAVAGGAAALIYAAKRGNGKGIREGFKNIWKGIAGKADDVLKPTRAMKEFNFVAKDGSKVYVKDGKITGVAIKGESTVLKTNAEVSKYLRDNKITIPNYLNGTKLSDGVKLTRYTIEHNGNKFVVENGKIIEAVNPNGKKVSKDKLDDFMEKLKGKKTLEDRIASIESGKNKQINKLEDVRYTYEKDGLIYSGWTDKGTERLTIPGKLNNKATEAEWKAWLNKNSEVDTQVKTLIEKGRVDGVSVKDFSYKDNNGNILFVNEKGEITSIQLKKKPKNGAQTLKPGTTEYDAWLYDNKEVKEAVKKEFESGLAPDGATFMAA